MTAYELRISDWSSDVCSSDLLGFMLLGMAMLKSGFLTGAWHRSEYLRIARLGYLAGGVPMIGLAYWCWSSAFEILATFTAVMSWSLTFRVTLTIAHAALLMVRVLRFADRTRVRGGQDVYERVYFDE